jgi:predicted DNA-binding WGR domain protein
MLSSEVAEKQIKSFQKKDGRNLRRQRASKLPVKLRAIGYGLVRYDEKGKTALRSEAATKGFEKAIGQFDGLPTADQQKILKAIVPTISNHVMAAWELMKTLPYQSSYERKPFRTPGSPDATRERRKDWLERILDVTEEYEEDVTWLAAWAPHLGNYWAPLNELGILFAAAIDSGSKDGEEVFEILCDSAGGQHEIGGMGRHVTRALMTCSKPAAWEFTEKLLLAAQRQEGLRQTILESIDEAHPEAFLRMLKLILDENLVRFSATVRAVDVWLSLQWDSVSTGVVKKTVQQLVTLLEDGRERQAALKGDDAEEAYYALWATSFRDAHKAIPEARKLLHHKQVEHRFVALHHLNELGLVDSAKTSVQALEDDDLRLVMMTVCSLGHESYSDVELRKGETRRPADLFDRLEAVIDRFPKKKQNLKALVWPWWNMTAQRQEVGEALYHNLGKRPVTRLIPYLRDLDTWDRAHVIDKMAAAKKWDTETRETLFAMVGDSSSYVREAALKGIAKCKVNDEEIQGLERLLTRKSADLRRGVLALLMKQTVAQTLASAERLMAGQQAQRTAGLEMLRLMVEKERSVEPCREQAEAYRQKQKKLTADENTLLDAILAEKQEAVTLDDALGLCDLEARTKPVRPKKHKVTFATKAAEECLKSLSDLVHAHRETEIKTTYSDGTELLGNVKWGFPMPSQDTPIEKDIARLPLAEVWKKWYDERPKKLCDKDGLELIRAVAIFRGSPRYRKSHPNRAALFGKLEPRKLRYASIVEDLVIWLLRFEPKPNAHDYLLDAAETAVAMVPEAELGRLVKEQYSDEYELPWREEESPWMQWLGMCQYYKGLCPDGWTDKHDVRLWKLQRWIDEPQAKQVTVGKKVRKGLQIPRERPDISVVVKALKAGAATEADVIDHLLGFRQEDRAWAFDSLRILTSKKPPKEYAKEKWLWPLVDRCRDRILEIEFARGETPTVATSPASALHSVWGTENVLRILTALGKGTLVRGYSYSGGDNKNTVFSGLLRVSLPEKSDTAEDFKAKAKAAGITDERLLDLAVYSPQWAKFVEHTLSWNGLEDAVWWIHAHTKDSGWSIDSEIREGWEAAVAERTPLSSQDLVDGGVDVEWFHRVYDTLKKKRWDALLESAKYAAGGGGHKRAELFASALLGREKKTDLVKRINSKRYQDAVRALGLLPLASGKGRQADVLSRYKAMQEFVRTSRQFGSQRQASEKRAATIGQQNLARTAGYADPIRLQWAMEAHAVADLADGPLTLKAGEVTVTLAIEETGGVEFTIEKAGKLMKSVPAILKKDKKFREMRNRRTELKRQVSRTRPTLEQMMCRGSTLTGGELVDLLGHAILGPMLSRLVLVGQGNMGFPARSGKALEDCDGDVTAVKKADELRIAHPMDLYESDRWHDWQKDCFARERIQPFKQVFRELYPVTKSELKDKTLSRRYAGHQVNPRQAIALLGSRGWVSVPEEGVRRTFHDEGYSAWLEFLEGFYTPADVEGLTLENVRFTKKGEWKPLPLKEMPSRLFSEVMRDLDLVVSVAHRGGVDPEASASTVEMRSNLMREALAVLSIDNVQFKKDHAIIQGELGRYNVHMGSGVVHKMPGGAMLIVPIHSQHRGRIFLPFADDDPKTAEVLSKVLLLARDSEIQDPNILEQIQVLGKVAPDKGAKKKRPAKRAVVKQAGKRYFELVDDKSSKFWEISIDGNDVTVRFGRIGAKGQTRTKTFTSTAAAKSHAEKLVGEKTGKGYEEGSVAE